LATIGAYNRVIAIDIVATTTPIFNTATVTFTGDTTPSTCNNTLETSPDVQGANLVCVEKTSDKKTVETNVSTEVNYEVEITNFGPDGATNVAIKDVFDLPSPTSHTTFGPDSAQISTGGPFSDVACNIALGATINDADVLSCPVGALGDGATATLKFQVTISNPGELDLFKDTAEADWTDDEGDHTTAERRECAVEVSVKPEVGDEGCTPGYWKQPQHLDSWVATGYSPTDDFDTVFGVNFWTPDITLLDALEQGGGGLFALGRHAVAALLDASHPDIAYPYTVAEVIALVQAFEKDTLADANELGCPLD